MPDQSTPDLQSAGVQGQDQDAASLLRALSQGPLQQAQNNPNLQAWAGLEGFGSGFLGQPNTSVNSLVALQESDRRQKLATYSVMQSVQRQRREKLQDQRKMATDLLSLSNPDARMMGAKILSEQLKSEGITLPPESIASQELTMEKRKEAYLAILAGQESGNPVTDDYLERGLGIPKYHIQNLRMEAVSDPIHKMLYGKSLSQEKIDLAKADLERDKFDLLQRRQDTVEARQSLSEAKEERQRIEAQTRLNLAERNTRAAESRLELMQKKFDYTQAKGPEEKRDKALDHAEWFANKLQEYAVKVDSQGFLPPTDKGVMGALAQGDTRALLAKTKRMTDSNNADWVFLTKHLQGEMIGYARSVQNDIGPRAMQAFQGAMAIMHDPPSLKALNEVVAGMRQAIQLGRDGKDVSQNLIIKHPNGQIVSVPWKRGMTYEPGDIILKVE